MYAKLVDGKLVEAPNNYRGIINYNKYPERMVEDGYKEVVFTNMPSDGYDEYDMESGELIRKAQVKYKAIYIDAPNQIQQAWVEDNEAS